MQAVKDKLHDMTAMRKAKAEAKAEEKTEKELAKARMDVAHEVRLAREAEAEMELHVAKAGQRVEREIAKHELNENNIAPQNNNNNNNNNKIIMDDKVCSYGSRNDDASTCGAGYASKKDNYCGGSGGGVRINSNAAATTLTGAPADATAAAHYTTAGRAASFPHNERL